MSDAIAYVALDPSDGSPIGASTPNVAGANVNLTSSGNIGQAGTPVFISLADLKSGNLTAAQRAALSDATAPGDVLEVGTNAQGQTVTVPLGEEPPGFTLTGYQFSPTVQLLISANNLVNANSGGSIYLQGTSENLTLGQVIAKGTLNITALGSVLSSGTGIQISTPGNAVLKPGTGSIGTQSAPLTTRVGGTISPYAPVGDTFINPTPNSSPPSLASPATNLAISPNTGISTGLTDTGAVTITGTPSAAAETVNIYDTTTNQDLGFATVTGTSFSLPINLAEGTHALRVRATLDGSIADASFTVTVDLTAPKSFVNSLASEQSTDSFPVSVGFDDPDGPNGAPDSGVVSVDLYDSDNGGPFTLYQTQTFAPTTSGTVTFTFAGLDRNTYAFYSVAHDAAGNIESDNDGTIEASTPIPDLNPPVSHILANNPSYSWSPFSSSEFSELAPSSYGDGVYTLNWAAADPDQSTGVPPGSISQVDIYVQIDGGTPVLIGQANAGKANSNGVYSGLTTYQVLGDSKAHQYNFFSVAIDSQAEQYQGNLAIPEANPDYTDIETITQTATTVTSGIGNATSVNANVGQSVVFTADVTANNHTPTDGSVEFLVNGVLYGSPVPLTTDNTGTASITITEPLGTYTIAAQYLGDALYAPTLPAAESTATLTVGLAATSTEVTSPTPNIGTGQSATFTAAVSSGNNRPPDGSVQFLVNGVATGNPVAISSGEANITIPFSTAGTYLIAAEYLGDNTYAATLPADETSLQLGVGLIQTSTTLSPDSATVAYGDAQTYTATVTAADGRIPPDGTVLFLVGGFAYSDPVPLSADGTAQMSVQIFYTGSYSVQAVYSGDDLYAQSVSETSNYTVGVQPGAAYNLAISPGTFNANADVEGWVTNTGTVTLTGSLSTAGSTVKVYDDASFSPNPVGQLTATGSTFSMVLNLPSVAFGSKDAEGFHQLDVETISPGSNTAISAPPVNIIVDLTPPTSKVNALGQTQTSDSFPVSVSYNDPDPTQEGADSNVSSVGLYVSVNGRPFSLYQTQSIPYSVDTFGTATFNFAGQDRNHYAFYSIAEDNAGNIENDKTGAAETSTYVPDLNPPVTHVLAANPSYTWNPFPTSEFSVLTPSSYSDGVFMLNWAGADPDQNSGVPAGSISTVDIYVEVDGGTPTLVKQLTPGAPDSSGVYSGSITYDVLIDGKTHTYSFNSVGVDDQNLSQSAPGIPDVTFTIPGVASATLTVITPATDTVSYGQSATFTATVSSSNGTPSDGDIQFFVNGASLGLPVAISNGQAQLALAEPVGRYTVAAEYTGDIAYAATLPAEETSAALTVNPAATTTVVTPATALVALGQSATFSAKVSSGNGTPPDGSLQFLVNGVAYGSPEAIDANGNATLAISEPVGSYTVAAKYTGDANFAATLPAAETSATLTVNPVATATAVTPATATVDSGQSATFTANVSSTNGTPPDGSLQFLIDGVAFGSSVAIDANGNAELAIAEPVGGYTVAAQYTGDTNYAATLQGAETGSTLTVTQAATTTAVTPATDTVSYGQSATFTADVSSATGAPPDGSVQFLVNGVAYGSPVALSVGVAQVSILEPPGTYTIAAGYLGDVNYAATLPDAETTVTLTVIPVATTTVVSPPTVTVSLGQPAYFEVNVTSANGAPPDGSAQFLVNGVAYGSPVAWGGSSDNTMTFELTEPAGTYTIAAEYLGDPNYAATLPAAEYTATLTVSQAASPLRTEMVVTPQTTSVSYGQSALFTATVTDTQNTLITPQGGFVQFTVNGQNYGSPVPLGNDGTAQLAITEPVGNYLVDAEYTGDTNFAAAPLADAPANLSVTPAATATMVTPATTTIILGQTATFTAAVTSGAGTPQDGDVQFLLNGTDYGNPVPYAGSPNNPAQITITGQSASSYTIAAEYLGDANYAATTPDAETTATLNVTLVPTTTSVTPSTVTVDIFDDSATFTAAVTSGEGSPQDGDVQFLLNGLPYGTPVPYYGPDGPLAQITIAGQSPGSYTVAVEYLGDSTYGAGTPDAETTGTLTVSALLLTNTYVYAPSHQTTVNVGQSVTFEAYVFADQGSPTDGEVQFLVNGAAYGSPVAIGQSSNAQLAITEPVGTYTVTAQYLGDDTFAATMPDAETGSTLTVNPWATATVVSSASDSVNVGQSDEFYATVFSANGTPPDGSLQFTVNGVAYGSPVVIDANGNVQLAITEPAGSYAVAAEYLGDNSYAATTPDAETTASFTVSPWATATTVAPASATVDYGHSATFTATVASATGSPPDGSHELVQFLVNGIAYGSPVAIEVNGNAQDLITEPVGNYTIAAEYLGDASYAATLPAAETSAALVVTPATTATIVTPGTASLSYGQSATFTASLSSSAGVPPDGYIQFLVNGALYGSPVAIDSGGNANIAITEPVGTYTVSSQYLGDPSFAPTQSAAETTATFTVTPAALNVIAAPQTKVYGSDDPAFTYKVTGLQFQDTATGVLTGSLTRAVGETVAGGPYDITLGTLAADANYTINFTPSTLTITKAHLTVTAVLSTTDIGHGDPVPIPTARFSGFVYYDNASVVSGSAGFSGLPTTSSPAGIYSATPITTGLMADNYDFPNIVSATINVHPVVTNIFVKWGSQKLSIVGLGRDLPFFDIMGFEVAYSDPVNINGTGVSLTSTAGGPAYSLAKVGSGQETTDQTWTLPTAIGIDRLMMALDQTNTVASNAPSLKLFGLASQAFSVLPGDFNGDGVVSSGDITGIIDQIGEVYDIFADLNGDGAVAANDAKLARTKIGTSLPPNH